MVLSLHCSYSKKSNHYRLKLKFKQIYCLMFCFTHIDEYVQQSSSGPFILKRNSARLLVIVDLNLYEISYCLPVIFF